MTDPALRLRRVPTRELSGPELVEIRALMDAAFAGGPDGDLTDDDWQHSLGGTHVVLDLDGVIAAHAAVVEREVRFGGRPLRTGYVEAVATAPDRQRTGLGSIVMADVGELIRDHFEIGMLGTGSLAFYERLGWRVWAGPSAIRRPDGLEPTPDEDGYLMVLITPATPLVDPLAPIDCDPRRGDSW